MLGQLNEGNIIGSMPMHIVFGAFNCDEMVAFEPAGDTYVGCVIGNGSQYLANDFQYQVIDLKAGGRVGHDQVYYLEVQKFCFRCGAHQGRVKVVVGEKTESAILVE